MQVEIITPEAKVFEGEAEAVQFPGLDGSFQVLNGHAAIISALTEGSVKVDLSKPFVQDEDTNSLIQNDNANKNVIRVGIKGGVMEMLNNKIIVLAE
ncbi:MAG: F0F1 ATP synthase subunit epsilon [Crocinitomicaceae bacterium]|nr:F0F1 ATP synthase subunit epsilon [Crocinitomicaceae bacterium]